MEVAWPYNRCIMCLREVKRGSLTKEHIIPEQIGGKLSVPFLCKPCNDQLGSEIEPEVKRDPAIRLALLNLETELPHLTRKLEQRQPYVGTGPAGQPVFGRIRNGGFRVDSVRSEDGSIIQPTPEGRAHIEKTLRKQNLEQNQIQAILRRFDQAPDGERLDLAPGLATIKRRLNTVKPALDGPLCSHGVLLKIAFEFLVCHLGAGAYAESEELAGIRRTLFKSDVDTKVYSVEELTTRRYAPLHRLALAGAAPHAIVTICLFGWVVYRVHLLQIAVASIDSTYTCLLDAGEEQFDVLDQGGKTRPASPTHRPNTTTPA
jgi:hypothetical protein